MHLNHSGASRTYEDNGTTTTGDLVKASNTHPIAPALSCSSNSSATPLDFDVFPFPNNKADGRVLLKTTRIRNSI